MIGSDGVQGESRHAVKWWVWVLLVVWAALITPRLVRGIGGSFDDLGLLDLQIYRMGGRAVLDGRSLYDLSYAINGLPFTYTPFAALVFVPLALAGWTGGAILITVASLAALVRTALLAVRSGGGGGFLPRWAEAPATAVLVLFGLTLWPSLSTLEFGQVNIVLMWLVVEDLFGKGRGSRWQGVGIGLATGIKLTPALFIVMLFISRSRRQAVTAAITFVGTVVVGFLLQPGSAWRYWTETVFDSTRIGAPAYLGNQSINGVARRVLGADGPSGKVWLVAAVIVVVGGFWVARRAWTCGYPAAAVLATSCVMLLVSPISWSHHWVWLMIAPAFLVVRPRSLEPKVVRAARYGIVALILAAAAPRLLDLLPNEGDREYDYSTIQHIVGAAYPLVAVAILVYFAAVIRRPAGTADTLGSESPAEGVGAEPGR